MSIRLWYGVFMTNHRIPVRSILVCAVLSAALAILIVLGVLGVFSAPAPRSAPTHKAVVVDCSPVAPAYGEELPGGVDFESWRDVVVEDGSLDYASGTWTLTRWDGSTEVVGVAAAKDSEILPAGCPIR